jgi:prolyl-tRNA editing enzyme YbaK/EbsC (Cys-tRNA(Pro) deacylase)
VVPGTAEVDLKKAAKASGNKSEPLPLRELEPLTGYVRGGWSVPKSLPVFIDETAGLWDSIFVSAGARGLQMMLSQDHSRAGLFQGGHRTLPVRRARHRGSGSQESRQGLGQQIRGTPPLRELEPLTGYVRGLVGTRKALPVYMDETASLWDSIFVSAGARGLQMMLS